jgi:hypothetical protein
MNPEEEYSTINVYYESGDRTLHYELRNTEDKSWPELLQAYINFLKGIGYEIPSEGNVV